MNHKTVQKMAVEAKIQKLRRKIEEKRKKLNDNIKEREDLLKYQRLSKELDHLIGQYSELMEKGLPDG